MFEIYKKKNSINYLQAQVDKLQIVINVNDRFQTLFVLQR